MDYIDSPTTFLHVSTERSSAVALLPKTPACFIPRFSLSPCRGERGCTSFSSSSLLRPPSLISRLHLLHLSTLPPCFLFVPLPFFFLPRLSFFKKLWFRLSLLLDFPAGCDGPFCHHVNKRLHKYSFRKILMNLMRSAQTSPGLQIL